MAKDTTIAVLIHVDNEPVYLVFLSGHVSVVPHSALGDWVAGFLFDDLKIRCPEGDELARFIKYATAGRAALDTGKVITAPLFGNVVKS